MAHSQIFGGDWTEKKLAVLGGYLSAYTTALQKQTWIRKTIYVDAFAGTGNREVVTGGGCAPGEPLFPEAEEQDTADFLAGSAKIALEADPPFDRYVFIEQTHWKARRLEELLFGYQDRKGSVIPGDANAALADLAAHWHPKDRGVVFLDPFGMALEWSTLESLAATKAVDVWLLFPLGQAVSRLLTHPCKQRDPRWETRLTRFFGTEEWRAAFFPKQIQQGLFGPEEVVYRDASYSAIEAFFRKRLQDVFHFVHERSLEMRNERGIPLFLLFFMMATENAKAHRVGKDIAGHLFGLHD